MKTTKLSKTIMGLPIPELRGSLANIQFPAFAELKIDGEFTFIIYDNGKIATMNKYNKVRQAFPALDRIWKGLDCKSAIMLGELYYGIGNRHSLYDLNSNKHSDDLELYVFDIAEVDGRDVSKEPLIDRKEILLTTCKNIGLKSFVVTNIDEANDFFNESVKNGFEGAVIKPMNGVLVNGPCDWVKLKMKDQTDYEVVTVEQSRERIEVKVPLATGGPVGPGDFVIVGVKAPLRYKRYINIGDMVTIEHQGVLPSGSLRHPVLIPKKEWR